jgi:cysteine-rich repeat protein
MSTPPGDTGGRSPEIQPCDLRTHAWVLETLAAGGDVTDLTPEDNINSVLQSLDSTKMHTLILNPGTYGAATIPADLNLRIIGHCDTPVVAAPWQTQNNTELKIHRLDFRQGLQFNQPRHVELDQVRVGHIEGTALTQTGGSLTLRASVITASTGHGLALAQTQQVVIDDTHFLGPLGGDGIFSQGLTEPMAINTSRFESIAGRGIHLTESQASAGEIHITNTTFLGPLGGDGVFSSNGIGPQLMGNQFQDITGHGVHLEGTLNAIIIDDNHFIGPLGGDGVFSKQGAGLTVRYNRFEHIEGTGLSVDSHPNAIIIDDNNFLGPLGGDGVFVWASGGNQGGLVQRNTMDNANRFGLVFGGVSGPWRLRSNRISATGERGLLVQSMDTESPLTIDNNTVEGAVGSGIELIDVLGLAEISNNTIDKIQSIPLGGGDAPASGFGLCILDSPRSNIEANQIRRTQLAGIVIDLGQLQGLQQSIAPAINVGANSFDGQSKFNVVIQNTGNHEPTGENAGRASGSSLGYAERFVVQRKRAGALRCGDGRLNDGEECDDGNTINTDACTNVCQRAQCGDGIRRQDQEPSSEHYEACDPGTDNARCTGCRLLDPKSLAVGNNFACALSSTEDGNHITRCWGSNENGEISDDFMGCEGNQNCSPVPVGIYDADELLQVAAGRQHWCTTQRNTTYCRGDAQHHQLFNDTIVYGRNNHEASWGNVTLQQLYVGGFASCIQKDQGIYCMGRLADGMEDWQQARALAADKSPTRAVITYSHYCVESALGVFCAGNNAKSAVSDNNEPFQPLVEVDERPEMRVEVGDHATCLIAPSGTLRCRGYNNMGRLGLGGDQACSTNCQRGWGDVQGIENVVDVSISATHLCALDVQGRVTCWGDNTLGALGEEGVAFRTRAGDQVPLPAPATEVRTGVHMSCALLVDHRVLCWGDNRIGQLGRRTLSEREMPGRVLGY